MTIINQYEWITALVTFISKKKSSWLRQLSQASFVLMPILFLLAPAQTANTTIYDFQLTDIDGRSVNMSDYKGKVIIVVNVASNSPLTPQYASLEKFYNEYSGKGVVILGFPSNSYKNELETDKDIRSFCRSKYRVSFPMFSKVEVKGGSQHPLFKFLSSKSMNGVMDAPTKMDFQKYIIDRSGKLIMTLEPNQDIYDGDAIAQINQLVGA